jgi:hypothetical protein
MVHGGLHTLPAVSSLVMLNALSWPFSYAVGPSVVGRGLHCKGTSVRFLTSPVLSHSTLVHMYSPSPPLY